MSTIGLSTKRLGAHTWKQTEWISQSESEPARASVDGAARHSLGDGLIPRVITLRGCNRDAATLPSINHV